MFTKLTHDASSVRFRIVVIVLIIVSAIYLFNRQIPRTEYFADNDVNFEVLIASDISLFAFQCTDVTWNVTSPDAIKEVRVYDNPIPNNQLEWCRTYLDLIVVYDDDGTQTYELVKS